MSAVGWEVVRGALRRHTPVLVDEPVGHRAAVAAVLREKPDGLELLFMRRAEHERDPWSGHVSFPGGRAEPGDDDLLSTAVRETAEETGLDLRRDAELLGRLDEVRAMARGRPVDLAIAPFVFRLHRPADGTPNHEVVSLHWLPLSRLLDPGYRSTLELSREHGLLHVPCLRIDELVIWGLTYRMFENFGELISDSARLT